MPAGPSAVLEKGRLSAILYQFFLYFPHQPLAPFLIGLAGLSFDQLVNFRIAVSHVIAFGVAHVRGVEALIWVAPASASAKRHAVVLAHDSGEINRAIDWLKLAVDVRLLQ